MTDIPKHIEAAGIVEPDYVGRVFTAAEIKAGKHRGFIGARWADHGQRQLAFLRDQGLQPEHRFCDIGAGCFRAGRFLVDYLDPAHYFAIDASASLLQTGYDIELTAEQRARLPLTNLRATSRFDVDFGVRFDFAIAQSVFSHIDLNLMRLCLHRAGKAMAPGGRFFATFYEGEPGRPMDAIIHGPGHKGMFQERNTFWYYRTDLVWIADPAVWTARYIGDWGHPAGQVMMEYTRRAA
jgi:SAM-dependent methyltransferase